MNRKFITYVHPVQWVFGSPLLNGKRGHPWLISWPDIHIRQVVKPYQSKCGVNITRRIVQGSLVATKGLSAHLPSLLA